MIALAVTVLKDTNAAARSELFRDHNGMREYKVPETMRGVIICEDVPVPIATDNVLGVCCSALRYNLGMFRKQNFKSLETTDDTITVKWD
jgi:hypothetical protein